MSAVSTVTRAAKSVVKAPLRVLRKMKENPVKTGLAFLAADIATKIPARVSPACLQTYFNDQGSFANSSFTQFLFGLGTASLAYLFTKTNSQTVKLGIALLASCAAGNIGEAAIFGSNADFISIGSWPTFNIADTANTLGGFTLLYDCFSSGGSKDIQERPTRLQTIKGSFSRNIWNTVQQTYLYVIAMKFTLGVFFKPIAMPAYLLLSLIRDVRHRGEGRMFK